MIVHRTPFAFARALRSVLLCISKYFEI
jgi:hypothetical protein